jgi:hypothetical protein
LRLSDRENVGWVAPANSIKPLIIVVSVKDGTIKETDILSDKESQ